MAAKKPKLVREEEFPDRLGKRQAARFLKVDPKTIGRMVLRNELEQGEDGLYDKAELEDLAELMEYGKDEDVATVALQVLKEALDQAHDHNEAFLRLLQEPMKSVLNTVTKTNENLLDRANKSEQSYIDNMRMMGEMLMQREEAAAVRAQSEAKQETMRKAGEVAISQIPELMSQFSGGRKLESFGSSITDEQKAMMVMARGFLDEEQKKELEGILSMLKVELPPEESEDGGDEKTEETPQNVEGSWVDSENRQGPSESVSEEPRPTPVKKRTARKKAAKKTVKKAAKKASKKTAKKGAPNA